MRREQAGWVLPAEDRSAAVARSLIAERFHDLPADLLEVVLLLTSELVTNAVRHGSGPVGVEVAWGDQGVRVEVEDESPVWPVVQAVDGAALSGRGLVLVDGLCSGWGVLDGGAGKKVWFTLDA